MIRKGGLGKGLDALISTSAATGNEYGGSVMELKINDIEPNAKQPRKKFHEDKLQQLSESIRENGVIQPIIVKQEGSIYRIIAGERRWRAARLAGLSTIPAIVKNVSDQGIMEMALIENLQREDLNPLEEAEAYQRLMDEFHLTQDEIGKRIGKSRPSIANTLRLQNLDDDIKHMVINEDLTGGHARALLAVEDRKTRMEMAKLAIDREWSVRELEKMIQKLSHSKRSSSNKERTKENHILLLEERLKSILGTKVMIDHKRKKGKITIEYYSNEELDRILEILEHQVH